MKKITKSIILILTGIILIYALTFSNIVSANDLEVPEGYRIVSSKKTSIVPGVEEREIIANTSDGKNPKLGFLVDINLGSSVGVMVASKNYNERGTQTVSEMARQTQNKTGRNIVAGINGDLNWSGTGLPNGPLIIDGTIYSDHPALFFGIKKSGEAVIGDANDFTELINDLEYATKVMGGMLVKDGEIVATGTGLAPRTALGIKADGTLMFYVVDGRGYPRSVGASMVDLATVMKSNGAVTAVNLDGGGSSTYIAKPEGTDELGLRNLPSDGVERPSITSILVYASVGDGVFNHASIHSEHDLYTPGSEVSFEAHGVDSAGGFAELPENITWEVEDESYGTIDSSGRFTSSGVEGYVNILLKDINDRIIGRGTVEIRTPDEITFRQNEYSLGFDESTNFGLRLLYDHREVKYKDGDIIWDYDPNLGVIEDNVFTSNEGETEEGTITATIFGTDISASFDLIVGKLPVVTFDFEDDEINEFWYPSFVNGAQAELHVVHRDSGEPVRYGDKALRIDFDFTTRTSNVAGAYAAIDADIIDAGIELQIPGTPIAVGMWVYATEEAQGLWLRGGIGIEGKMDWKAFNYNDELTGIDWIGWKFVTVEGLTDHSGPYTMLPGQFIRLMTTAASFGGNTAFKPKGSIYVDNITAIYGENPEDFTPPIVDSIKINDQEVRNNQTFTNNNFVFETSFYEFEEKYATGVDFDNVNIYIDGINYRGKDGYELDITNGAAYLQNVELADGLHEIKISVFDNAGNEVVERRIINVDTKASNKVFFEKTPSVVIGKEYNLELKADMLENIKNAKVSLQLSNNLENFDVEFGSGFEGEFEYINGIRILNIEASRLDTSNSGPQPFSLEDDYIFKITFNIDSDLSPSSRVLHSVISGEYETLSNDGDYLRSFSDNPVNIGVSAPLKISTNIILLNQDAIIMVKDFNNNPVEHSEVFLDEHGTAVSLGYTDENGVLIVSDLSLEVRELMLTAQLDENISFQYQTQVFDSYGDTDGTPYSITQNAYSDPHSNKNITWFSNVFGGDKSFIEYALLDDYNVYGDSAFNRVQANTSLYAFTGSTNPESNYAININNIVLDNLESGKHYIYRVGNDDIWSELKTFETVYQYSDVEFLILGDIQTSEYENFIENINKIQNSHDKFDFVIQTGDMVDSGDRFDYWNETLMPLSNSFIGDIDIIHVLGNHEFYGDDEAINASAIYNLPENQKYYSYEYGIVYVAVINYTLNRDNLIEALEWLVDDANNSNAKWKILLTHQPPYYTNPQGGSDLFNQLVPSYVQLANMDIVISGHDHTYARTKPLYDGSVDSVKGIPYIIAGAFGEKGYSGVNNPNFHFETLEDQFESVYLTVSANEREFVLTAYDNNTSIEIDTTVLFKTDIHDHNYYYVDGRLVCYECNYSRPLDEYVGFLRDKENRIMYYLLDRFQKGIYFWDNDIYYFDEDGYALTGDTLVWGLETKFSEDGKFISGGTGFITENDKTYYFQNLQKFLKGGLNKIDNKYYYFSSMDFSVRKGIYNAVHLDKIYILDDETGEALIGEVYYYGLKILTNNKGEFVSGGTGFIKKNDTIYYYLNGLIQKNGFNYIDGDIYYIRTTNSEVVTGKYGYYEFDEWGRLIKGRYVKDSIGTRYLLGFTGVYNDGYVTGFYEIDDDLYYFDEDGYLQIGEFEVEGFKVTTDSNGVIIF